MALPETSNRFFGYYEAKVEEAFDAENITEELVEKIPGIDVGWLKITVPRFLGGSRKDDNGNFITNKFFYARPETMFGGVDGVGTLIIPPVGAKVLVFFIAGDLAGNPVWKSSLWRKGESSPPSLASRDYRVLFYDEVGNTIGFSKKTSTNDKGQTEEEYAINISSPVALNLYAGKNVTIHAEEEDVTVTAKNIIVEAKEEVKISAQKDVNISSDMAVNVSAPRVSLN